ncbi:MAG TPA: glycosyltransferase family A protein [Kiritimatiellia bacterium]|nr:glycosyltransferase family A protein [Kiritimatiellia bacterium]
MSVKDGARYVRQAINSILAQDYTGWEFIIIDDASTDETPRILESYGDSRIRLFRNEANLGLAKSLNRGLELARGEFVARQDHDDVSAPSRLRRQVQRMDMDPDLVLLGTRGYQYDEETGLVGEMLHPLDNVSIRLKMCHQNAFIHSSVFIRRNIMEKNKLRFNEVLSATQDYELWTRLCDYGRVLNLSNKLVTYRWHGASISRLRSEEQRAVARQVSSAYIRRALPTMDAPDPEHIRQILCGDRPPAPNELTFVRALFDNLEKHAFVSSDEVRASYLAWASKWLDGQRVVEMFSRAGGRLLRSCRGDALRYLVARVGNAAARRVRMQE